MHRVDVVPVGAVPRKGFVREEEGKIQEQFQRFAAFLSPEMSSRNFAVPGGRPSRRPSFCGPGSVRVWFNGADVRDSVSPAECCVNDGDDVSFPGRKPGVSRHAVSAFCCPAVRDRSRSTRSDNTAVFTATRLCAPAANGNVGAAVLSTGEERLLRCSVLRVFTCRGFAGFQWECGRHAAVPRL